MRTKTNRLKHLHHHLPSVAHLFEVVAAIIIFSSGQNVWAALVRADGDNTPPSVPTGLMVTGQSPTEIDLGWTASTDNVGVTGYDIYRNGTLIGTSVTNSYANMGLSPDTNYSYMVSAYDAAGNNSAQSTALNTNTLQDTSPPSTPSNLHQTGQSVSTISIAWDPSSDNVAVASYNIYRNGNLIRNQAQTSYTDTGLAVYTNYTYTVQAIDTSNNYSNLSSALYASTAQDTMPPTVPDNVHETGSTVSSVNLAWDNSTDNVGVAGYHVYRNGVLVGSPGGNSFTDTGLIVDSSYTYTISAYDAANNNSAQSAPFSASSSTDTTPPTIPTYLETTTIKDNSISISWTASTDNVEVAGYKIYRNNTLVGTSTSTTFTDNGLQPVTNYSYTVEAYDEANNVSAASAPLATQTAFDTTPPSTPTGVNSPTQTDTTIRLSWTASTDNVAVGGYNIYRNGSLLTTTVGTSYTDSGLAVDTSYSYTVQAVDTSANTSTQSMALLVSTIPDTIPPSMPSGLSAANQTMTSTDLSWNASTDDVAVASYNIYRNGALVGNTVNTTYTDNSLTYNTTYSYNVTAVDTSGNESNQSAPLAVTTLPDSTTPSVQLSAPTNGQAAELTFPITASATDEFGISEVQFYADSTLIDTITSPSSGNTYSFNWNSYAVHNGNHVITAKAIDPSGNTGTDSITIDITNPPPPLVGDLNGDHKVNIYDLSILLSNWGKSGLGDFENTGRVNIFDLSILLSHYGEDDSNYQ